MNNVFYILTGFWNSSPFTITFTLTDLINNKGAHQDTETFYSLQGQISNLVDLKMYEPMVFNIDRNNPWDKALITRVGELNYTSATINHAN
jgi:hypothetical protein